MEPIKFTGASGAVYFYYLARIDEGWAEVPVNYMFACLSAGRQFIPYIGEAENARTRFSKHERWAEAVRDYGVTFILNHVGLADAEARRREERDLILALDPAMNVHHRPTGLGAFGGLATGTHGLIGLGALGPRKTR